MGGAARRKRAGERAAQLAAEAAGPGSGQVVVDRHWRGSFRVEASFGAAGREKWTALMPPSGSAAERGRAACRTSTDPPFLFLKNDQSAVLYSKWRPFKKN